MKNLNKKSISLLVVVLLLVGIAGTAYAALNQKTINVSSGVKIYMNGKELIPTDVNGKVVDAFVYEGTTYLPARALSEALGKNVEWDDATGSVYITDPGTEATAPSEPAETPQVFMTTDISPEGLISVYKALGREATGDVAFKLHLGEPGGNYFLSPDLIKGLVQSLDGYDCGIQYGRRNRKPRHYRHAFTGCRGPTVSPR